MQVCFIESKLVRKLLEYKKKNDEFKSLKTLIILDEENIEEKFDESIDGVDIYIFSKFE